MSCQHPSTRFGKGVARNFLIHANANGSFAIEKVRLNSSLQGARLNNLPCLRINIKLRRRETGNVLYGPVEALQRRPYFFKAIIGYSNPKIGPRRTAKELHIGAQEMEWNEQDERLSEFIMSTHTIHGNSQFQKPSHLHGSHLVGSSVM
ncbi:hypothetical protein V3C99_012789 [Haemonchus contortus]|uniref:Uncharacterized protein n=1 Tax=Haemonchus contortus TaxID=6289 RepID=A0A7I5E769_HAECO